MRYGPHDCPSDNRCPPLPARSASPLADDMVGVSSMALDVSVSMPAPSRHTAQSPSAASGGSSRPQAGHRPVSRVGSSLTGATTPGAALKRGEDHARDD